MHAVDDLIDESIAVINDFGVTVGLFVAEIGQRTDSLQGRGIGNEHPEDISEVLAVYDVYIITVLECLHVNENFLHCEGY